MKTRHAVPFGLTAKVLLATLFALALAPVASAATVSWTGSNIFDPSDISTNGTPVGALNVGVTNSATINGVTFMADTGSTNAIPLGSATVAIDFNFGLNFNNDFWASPAPGGDADYDLALDYGRHQSSVTNGTVTLGGLTVGGYYEVQLWLPDTRSCCSNRIRTVDGTLVMNAGAGPHIARGIFEASSSTQVITISSVGGAFGAQLNLLQLRNSSAPPGASNLSAPEIYTKNTPLDLVDIVVSDVDSVAVTATLTLSDTNAGALSTATSGAVTSTYDAMTGVWTASGAIADVNTLLAGLTFVPASNYDSHFTIATSVSDGVAAPVVGSKTVSTLPVVTISSPPTNSDYTSDTTPSFVFSTSGGVAPLITQCRVDGALFAPGSSPFTVASPLGEGAHVFEARAIDSISNTGLVASFNFTVDTIPPTVNITVGPNYTSDTTPTFEFAAIDSSPVTTYCSVDGDPFVLGVSPFTTGALSDGVHTFEVYGVDAAGNLGSTNSLIFTVDTEAPTVNITGGPAAVTSDNTPTFQFSVSAGGSPVTTYCRVDGNAFAQAPSPFTPAPLTDGPHTFEVYGADAAGNVGSTNSHNFTVDSAASLTSTLIIPMDTGTAGQNDGMFRAYGLVYELLRHGIPVRWSINAAKAAGGDDFVIDSSGGNAVEDVRTSASVALPRSYRGGPFVVDGADAAAALPIIEAWQATGGDQTAVHRLTSGSVFMPIARVLMGAPRIALLEDGNEVTAFSNLNAAGIPDSAGGLWAALSVDLLAETNVVGSTTNNDADGALFHTNGLTRYSFLASMHYNTNADTPEVVQEVRSWLDSGNLTHAFMQCASITVFENDTNGHFLTTAGLQDDGATPTNVALHFPDNPLSQLDGAFAVDTGTVDSIGLAGGSAYRPGTTDLINESNSPITQRIVLLTGRMDGDNANGRVTYLGGHDYSLSLPITSNPQANGVRLFLNSIFETGVASGVADPDVMLTVSAPTYINTSLLTYTLSYVNPGTRPVENLLLTDELPVGAGFVSASDGGTNVGGVVNWTLPTLAPGASNSVTLMVNLAGDGSYTNSAQMDFAHRRVKTIRSAPVATLRDTDAPTVTITSGPTGYTNDNTPTIDYVFSTNGSPVSIEVKVDLGVYEPAPMPLGSFTTTALTEGLHVVYLRATDAAGNMATATRVFTVDTIAPVVTIASPPINPEYTSDTTPTLLFSVGADASPVNTYCSIDGGGFVPAPSPFTSPTPLTDGPHTFEVYGADAAGNLGSTNLLIFTVDTEAPTVNITGGPAAVTSDNTPTFEFSVSGGGSPVTTYCRFDGDAFIPGASPFTSPTPLTDGPHTFEVYGADEAGNVGSTDSLNFTVDTTPPTLTIVPVPPDQVMISWIPDTPGFVLQETPALSPAAWTNAPSGTNNPVTVSAANPATLYRLKNQ